MEWLKCIGQGILALVLIGGGIYVFTANPETTQIDAQDRVSIKLDSINKLLQDRLDDIDSRIRRDSLAYAYRDSVLRTSLKNLETKRIILTTNINKILSKYETISKTDSGVTDTLFDAIRQRVRTNDPTVKQSGAGR